MQTALPFIASALALGWTVVVHQGLGLSEGGMATRWWQPTGFLLSGPLSPWLGEPSTGVPLLALPGALAAAVVALTSRSGLLLAVTLSSVACCALFGYYGLYAPFVWEFFHWRGSLTLLGVAVSVGAALAAPWLVRSWLALRPSVQIPAYGAPAFAVCALVCSATGTDPRLPFNFSPWPALSLFGLEVGAYSVTGLWLGVAFALALASGSPSARGLLAAAGLALLVPPLWFVSRFGPPSGPELALLCGAGAVAFGATLLASRQRPDPPAVRATHALHFGLAGVLLAIPLLSGRAFADADYAYTKHIAAKRISDALARYWEEEGVGYPETLETLLEAGYLAEIPRPRAGFAWLAPLGLVDEAQFRYVSLGSSYMLEFISTDWVQCVYNPPWEDESIEADATDETDETLEEAWSCPDSRPVLW